MSVDLQRRRNPVWVRETTYIRNQSPSTKRTFSTDARYTIGVDNAGSATPAAAGTCYRCVYARVQHQAALLQHSKNLFPFPCSRKSTQGVLRAQAMQHTPVTNTTVFYRNCGSGPCSGFDTSKSQNNVVQLLRWVPQDFRTHVFWDVILKKTGARERGMGENY